MMNPILKEQWNWTIYYYYFYNILFTCHLFFAYQNPIFSWLLVLIAFL